MNDKRAKMKREICSTLFGRCCEINGRDYGEKIKKKKTKQNDGNEEGFFYGHDVSF